MGTSDPNWPIHHKLAKLYALPPGVQIMAKRILKRSPKPKAKAAGIGAPYARHEEPTPLAVREVSTVRYEQPPAGRSVPATQAKNRFGEILQTARDLGPVFIERHGQAQAVVLSIDTYNKLTSNERTSQERELDYWTREFHVLHARMQTQDAREAVDALFSATDAELNRSDT
jgi:prevent-host-death family protein